MVGVVPDSKVRGLRQSEIAALYLPYNSNITANAFVVRAASGPFQARPRCPRSYRFHRSDHIRKPLSSRSMKSAIRAAWRERFFGVLTTCFTALAILL